MMLPPVPPGTIPLFDSHCHLHDRKFDGDRDGVLARSTDAGVRLLLTLGTHLDSSRHAIALAEESPHVLAAAGFHPSDADRWDDDSEAALEQLLAHPRVVVLGEIGLDYYWSKDPAVHEMQQRVFRAQLRMARRLHLPVSIHCRESNDDVLAILEEENAQDFGGVLHCFGGTLDQAHRAIALSFALGIGGSSTYKNAQPLRDVLRAVGPGHLLVETDAPYLPPEPHRGQRNEPAHVAITARRLAETLGLSIEQLAPMLWENTMRTFRIQPDA